MHLAWWAEPREMDLSAGICDRHNEVSVRFVALVAITPSAHSGVAG